MDTKSKRRWDAPPLTDEACEEFKQAMAEAGYKPEHVLPHGSYLMNIGSPRPEILRKSRECLIEEMDRCRRLGLIYYNFHPGSSCGEISTEECIKIICESINDAHRRVSGVVTVLENTAGQGSTVGRRFEELKEIIDGIEDKSRVGVCLDTCHAFAAGYDVRSDLESVLQEFDRIIGFKYLRGLHINDSKSDLGSRHDRHENIGKGMIGLECFWRIMNDDRFNGIPLILETPAPDGLESDRREIDLMYSLEGLPQPPQSPQAPSQSQTKRSSGRGKKAAGAAAAAASRSEEEEEESTGSDSENSSSAAEDSSDNETTSSSSEEEEEEKAVKRPPRKVARTSSNSKRTGAAAKGKRKAGSSNKRKGPKRKRS